MLSEQPKPETETPPVGASEDEFVVAGPGIFCGTASRLFIGIVMGAAAVFAIGHLYNVHQRAAAARLTPITLARTRTSTVSASDREMVAPAPIVIPIDRTLVHVSAIAMGHPRLAVINGQTVAEGDYVTLKSAAQSATIRLRVRAIHDGAVQLDDGKQTITTSVLLVPSAGSNRNR